MSGEKRVRNGDEGAEQKQQFYAECSAEESRTIILIDDGNQGLSGMLAAKGYGVVHLAAKNVNPGMLVCLISSMSMSRRKTALIADISREEADAVASMIWEMFPSVRVVITDTKMIRTHRGTDAYCDMIIPNDPAEILSILESYRTPLPTEKKTH